MTIEEMQAEIARLEGQKKSVEAQIAKLQGDMAAAQQAAGLSDPIATRTALREKQRKDNPNPLMGGK